jgi:hypothetical protein
VCKDVVFHFNKKHLEDDTIPMWVIKLRGETYYVNHVDCSVPWSTKETPDNSHTKGAIKVKHCYVAIDTDNCAVIRAVTEEDKLRFKSQETVRVITEKGSALKTALAKMSHSPIKMAGGGCGTTWYITDIPSKKHFTILQLQIPYIRQLMPNEDYYKQYDQASADSDWLYDDDDFDYEDLYEE